MARKESSAWNCIHAMCDAQQINESILYEKAKLLLGCYRRVCWAATGRCEAIADEEFCYCDNGLGAALGYLQGFEPAAEKPHFESKIRSLFATRGMIELVDNAMLRVKEFPDYAITTSRSSPKATSIGSNTMSLTCWISYISSGAVTTTERRKPLWCLGSPCGEKRFPGSRLSLWG